MQNLLKFALLTLISLTTLNAFQFQNPNNPYSMFMNMKYFPDIKKIDADLINSKYFRFNNDIYKIEATWYFFVLVPSSIQGLAKGGLYFYFFNYQQKTTYCEGSMNSDRDTFSRNCHTSATHRTKVDYIDVVQFTASKIATCQPDENFNTETQQCQKCPEGQSWDKENNRCFPDCSDVNKNKWGFTDGSCIDCSSSKLKVDVGHCYCNSRGTSFDPHKILPILSNGLYGATCVDGEYFEFKDPNTPDVPKPDNNNTTPSNPGGSGNQNPGGSGGDNGGGSGGNQGGGSGGNGGNSGGGSGGQDNQGGNTGGSGGNNNGNNQGNGNSVGGSGGSGSDNGKDKDAKFDPKDFDFKDLEKDVNDFKSKYSDALDTVYNSFTNTKQGIEQFIANVQGKGMNGITKKNVPTTCPRIYTINFNGYPSELNFDFCKVVSPASGAFYHLFYVIFFLGFLMLIVKLLILSF